LPVRRVDGCSSGSASWFLLSACEAKCFHHQDTKGTKSTRPPDTGCSMLDARSSTRPRTTTETQRTQRKHRATHPPFNAEARRGRTDALRARRPVRRPAAMNARLQRRRASRWRQAIRSPVVLPAFHAFNSQDQQRPLCVFASLRGGWKGGLCVLCGSKMGGRVALCPL